MLAVLAGCSAQATPALKSVSVEEFEKVLEQEVVLLDIRTPEEFAQGQIEGATLIDYYDADFTSQLEELDKDKTYAIYCRSGARSGDTLALMQELGFTSVYDLSGGILAWNAAGNVLVGNDQRKK